MTKRFMKRSDPSDLTGVRLTRRSAVALLAMISLMAGCGTYQLQGKTVPGPVSAVYLVDRDDPRLDQPGLPGATVSLTLDPDRLSAKHVGEYKTDPDGRFAIEVKELGAGVLEYDVRLDAHLAGHGAAVENFRLPSRNKRVLVMLGEGEGSEAPQRGGILDETLRWSEPYMN